MSDSDTSRTSIDFSLTFQSLGDEYYIQQRFCAVVLDLIARMGECYCSYLDSFCFAHEHSVRASSFIDLCFAHLWPYLLYMSKGVGYEWKDTFGKERPGDSFNHWWFLNWSTDNAKSWIECWIDSRETNLDSWIQSSYSLTRYWHSIAVQSSHYPYMYVYCWQMKVGFLSSHADEIVPLEQLRRPVSSWLLNITDWTQWMIRLSRFDEEESNLASFIYPSMDTEVGMLLRPWGFRCHFVVSRWNQGSFNDSSHIDVCNLEW
jgi:hypothetical protein